MKEQPQCKVYANGNKRWHLNGLLHREDGPAIENTDGSKGWFLNGDRHREDGPACEYADGSKAWYLNGNRHREDGPAVEWSSEGKEWHLHGEMVHPEEIVDYHLSRGTFCYYDKQSNELRFEE